MKNKVYRKSDQTGRKGNNDHNGNLKPRHFKKAYHSDGNSPGGRPMRESAGSLPDKRDSESSGRKLHKPYYKSDEPGKSTTIKYKKRDVHRGKKLKSFTRSSSPSKNEEMRLNRYLAQTGICSRREADEFIKAGLVSVNGSVIKEMGVKVKPGDIVKYNGETIRSEKKVYILLNKPKDYVTSLDDEKGRRTITDLIRGACRERVYPVGRLDRNTTGVMLLTNDGDLSAKLTHPKYNKKKIYHVHLDKNLKHDDLKTAASGIELDDGPIVPDSITYIEGRKRNEIGIEIHSGRNRIVRRMFEYLGYRVIRLDRVYFAGLTKKNLPRGKWRFLDEKEINMLKMNAYD